MEQILLWVSFTIGVLVFLGRFVPLRSTEERGDGTAEIHLQPILRLVGILCPFVIFCLTLLPKFGGVFHEGQRLGIGFLVGGTAILASNLDLLFSRSKRPALSGPLALTSAYGICIAAVAVALLFLRQSLMDGLMGVALGGFCVTFALFLALPRSEQQKNELGGRLSVTAGLLIALSVGAGLGVYRDPLTPELAKLTWSAILLAFAAFATFLVTGATLLRWERLPYGRLLPLGVLIGIGGLALYQVTTKIANNTILAFLGIGGLLLWAIVLAVLREGNGKRLSTTPLLSLPLFAVLVVTIGFLAALQTLQGTGVAIGVLALFLAYPSTLSLTNEEESLAKGAIGVLLFSTLLLLWRFFTTRFAGDLRGVNLTDQYALFGLLVGAVLPGLLATIPARFGDNDKKGNGIAFGTLAVCGLLTVLAPATVVVLFGAKSVIALLIGLALGALPLVAGEVSLFAPLLAMGIALVLDQFTGILLPVEAPTRAEKIRYLAMIVASLVVTVIVASRIGAGSPREETETV